ncbi:DUF3800 domain-containing protein [Variovorax gossypii]|nr:DUF3800 domain-containing protein [Variovorax gossypii]
MDVMDFYGDESCCHGGDHFLVIGGIAIPQIQVSSMEDRLRAVRATHPKHLANSEVKWSNTSRAVLNFYKEFSDVFFDAAKNGEAKFTSLCMDKRTFNHKTYNAGDPDIGFNKMVYQLLLHKVGKVWGKTHRITVKLDHRTSKDDPNELCPMLNHHLKRQGIDTSPFKRIEFKDSKKSELIQLNDLLIGTLGANHNKKTGAAHKQELADHIMKQAKNTCHPKSIYGWSATTFKVWPFEFRGR